MFHIGPEANEISRRALEPAAQILRGVVVQYTNRCFDDFSDRLVVPKSGFNTFSCIHFSRLKCSQNLWRLFLGHGEMA